jgi:hypothetical protein
MSERDFIAAIADSASPDCLAVITAITDVWEATYALLRKHVIAFLAKKPDEILPRDLALSAAISNLAEAVHCRVAFQRAPWLVVGDLPVNSLAEVDYQLEHLKELATNAGIALELEILLPNERSKAIRAWLAYEKSKAIAAATPTHSDDFTSVNWFGAEYEFAKGLQAESVKALWEAWEAGTPNLSQETIGDKAGSSNVRFRLEHVFKPTKKKKGKREPHHAWGTMIKSTGKGVFALSPP